MDRDIFGEALFDFFSKGKLDTPLYLHTSYGDRDEMPIEIFFRDEEDYSELEAIALALCDGHVLDVGAGAGAHALHLQQKGFTVSALDISKVACAIMQQRGVKSIINDDFFSLEKGTYDTLLLLMNGIGLVGTLDGFRRFLAQAKRLLSENGQILFDTSDISYLYQDYDTQRPEGYFGEIIFQYEYHRQKANPFPWLYLDQETLIRIAHEEGWIVQILYEDDADQYLVRMEPRKPLAK